MKRTKVTACVKRFLSITDIWAFFVGGKVYELSTVGHKYFSCNTSNLSDGQISQKTLIYQFFLARPATNCLSKVL